MSVSKQGTPGKNEALVLSRTVNVAASEGAPAGIEQGGMLLEVGGWEFPGSRMPAAVRSGGRCVFALGNPATAPSLPGGLPNPAGTRPCAACNQRRPGGNDGTGACPFQ